MLGRFADAQRRRGILDSSIHRRQTDLIAFLRDHPDPFGVTGEQIESFVDARRGRGGGPVSPRTRYCWISNLHEFYKWAIRQGLTDTDPTVMIDRPRLRPGLPRPISDDDLLTAIETADVQMRAWLSLMAYAGLRCAEVAWLTRERVIDSEQLLHVIGKGRRERLVPIHPEAWVALRAHGLPKTGHVFRSTKGRPWTPARISAIVSEYLDGRGIDATAHQLRHWFGTNTYAACHDIRVVQELMGHSSPMTTAGYAAWSRTAARDAVLELAVRRHPANGYV